MTHHPFTFFETYMSGVDHSNLHKVGATFVVGLLALAAFFVYPQFRKAKENVLPSPKFGVKNVFEVLIEMLAQLADDIIGHDGKKYLPFVGTIFFFMFFSNLLGLVPGFLPPTENWATGAAVATIVFISYNFFGFQAHGPSYLKHFIAPISLEGVKNVGLWILIMIPLVAFQILFGTIELISNFLRPITLSIRLFVNVTADHKVLEAFSGLAPYIVPLPFMVMGIFVSFMQAFIFSLLTMVYISMAVAKDH